MDIITRIRETIINLYSKKTFRLLVAAIFLAFVLKNYSSIPQNIEKNNGILNIVSTTKIKNKIEEEAFLKQEKREKIKQAIEKREEEQKYNAKIIEEKQILKSINDAVKTPAKQTSKKTSLPTKSIAKKGDLVIVEMVIFDSKTGDISNKFDEMSILINDDPQNVFAKYLINKKIGELAIIPVANIINNQQLPDNNITYKLIVKDIKNLNAKH